MWRAYLAKELPTPFDIFYVGVGCGAILGATLAVWVLSLIRAIH